MILGGFTWRLQKKPPISNSKMQKKMKSLLKKSFSEITGRYFGMQQEANEETDSANISFPFSFSF